MHFLHLPLILLMVASAITSCSKREGCIDPNASNYLYEAKKNDGSCLYDMGFWLNTNRYGGVDIFVDGVYRDYLNCYWNTSKPVCGVNADTLYTPSFHCVANIPLVSGNHLVRIEAYDGTIWEETFYLPENCLNILITEPD